MLSELHKRLLNDFQRDFPLVERPYLEIANRLGVSEEAVLQALTELSESDLISRIGPVIPPNRIGSSLLAAMAVPPADLHRVADIVNSYNEINHNYEREHRFNLWFVVAATTAERLNQIIRAIEQRSGYDVQRLPLIDDFFIDLGFKMDLDHV